MKKNKTIVISTGTARNEAGSGEIYTFLDRRKIKALLLSFLALTVSTATLPAQAEDPAEPCEEPPCELVEPCEDPPCECEEPPCDPEPHSYLPLFGEYETSYNIYVTGLAGSLTDSTYYTGEREIDGKIYKEFNGIHLLHVTEDNSKVYYHRKYTGEDILTFDISLEKGDSFAFSYYPDRYDDCIVDSVYTDEKGRKNLILLSPYHRECFKFIEGEGSSIGFFLNLWWGWDYIFLLCSHKDGEQSYFYYEDFWDVHEKYGWGIRIWLPDNPSCYIEERGHGSIDENSAVAFRFYPNPAQDWITVEAQDAFVPANTVVEIIDATGRVCLQKNMEESLLELPLKGLQKGTYILRVVSGKKQLYSNTLLIEK